jgi:AcrR family transcriptional regulator
MKRGRPRGYDRAVALQRLRMAFARRGYAGASTETLSRATGLHRPSLDRAFGDKRRMFHASLEHEHRALQARLQQIAGVEDAIPRRIERFLESVVADYSAAVPEPSGLALAAGLAEVTCDRRAAVWLRRTQRALKQAAERALGPAAPELCELLADLALGLCVRGRLAQGGIECDADLAVRARLIATLLAQRD